MKRVLVVTLAMLATAAPAYALSPIPTPPNFPSGSSVGEGVPLKAYASVTPQVQLFGAPVTATLAIVADTKWVDTARLQVTSSFVPYKPVAPPTVTRLQVGRFAQITWRWTLRCLTSPCVPRVPPSDRVHVFTFHQAHIRYLATNGKPEYELATNWPVLEVYSQLNVATVDEVLGSGKLRWLFHLTPLAAPTYARSPALLFWLALGLGLAFFAGAAFFGWRVYLVLRPPATAALPTERGTPLERALAVLAYAHERGDETLQRKAFERVADELGIETTLPEVDELTRTAREFAWSSRTPADDEIEVFAEQARETGKRDE
ncbi:MAG TPA: hypothetical protein VKP14_05155 [Gaiellaceae bacterium]|nr:hypothetical protein [Gaiellaceae bacterium]